MGIDTDLIVGKTIDTEKLCQSPDYDKDCFVVAVPHLTVERFAGLLCILRKGRLDSDYIGFCARDFELVHQSSLSGPWIFEVPAELVSRVASASQQELKEIGSSWILMDEFSKKGWAMQHIVTLLEDIQKACGISLSKDESLMLRVSL